MTDTDWINAYRGLLGLLRESSSTDESLILAVEEAASARIEEEVTEESDFFRQVSSESKSNLDSTILRPPDPRESFVAAVSVLIARLREVPILSKKMSEKIGRDATDIQWKTDVPQEQDRGIDSFSALDLQVGENQIEQVEATLRKLEALLDINSNDNVKRTSRYS